MHQNIRFYKGLRMPATTDATTPSVGHIETFAPAASRK
jgi:hypothetical protein